MGRIEIRKTGITKSDAEGFQAEGAKEPVSEKIKLEKLMRAGKQVEINDNK